MLRKLVKYFFFTLVLILVFLSSALLAMRFAIQGREVRVPRLNGLTPIEAERAANSSGLVLSVENRFYSTAIPQGRIVSQSPNADATVRRGWKIRVAESLGPQRAAVPNLIGQSQHAAGINLSRRGLEMGTISTIRLPGAPPNTVVAQDPSADAVGVASPKVNLVFSAPDNAVIFATPSFVGKQLADAKASLEKAGFTLGKVQPAAGAVAGAAAGGPGTIVRQFPQAGQRIAAGATISFDVKK